MILLIDNYDSFTYNLYQLIEELQYTCVVKRNDEITTDEIAVLQPDAIVISPGPGHPDESGVTLSAIRDFAGKIPIFGVCLGHQAIGAAFGGKVIRAPQPKHGKVSLIRHDDIGIFSGIANPFPAARYHSLILERGSLPDCLSVTCETEDGLVMGIRHKTLNIEGVQFHPESIATKDGALILGSFLGSLQ